MSETLKPKSAALSGQTKPPQGEAMKSTDAYYTADTSFVQLPPLAAKLDDLASHAARIAENTNPEIEALLIILAHNLAAVAEQVGYMENNLEVPA